MCDLSRQRSEVQLWNILVLCLLCSVNNMAIIRNGIFTLLKIKKKSPLWTKVCSSLFEHRNPYCVVIVYYVRHWKSLNFGGVNRNEWIPVYFVIIRVINKIGRPRSVSPTCYLEFDYRHNSTTRCLVTNSSKQWKNWEINESSAISFLIENNSGKYTAIAPAYDEQTSINLHQLSRSGVILKIDR